MLSSQDIERKLAGFGAIDDIVGAMKAYAGLAIRKTGDLVENVRQYEANVLIALADLAAHYPGLLPPLPDGKRIITAFGSSQGLCGSYNERLADAVAGLADPGDLVFLSGRRLRDACAARGIACAAWQESVGNVNAIPAALRRTVADLAALSAKEGYRTLTAIFLAIARKEPRLTTERILPPVADRLPLPQPRPFPPETTMPPHRVFAAMLDEFLAVSLYRCYLESLRSENWFRLRSMEGASENLKRRIAELAALGRYARQEEITEELLEILGSGVFSRRAAGEA